MYWTTLVPATTIDLGVAFLSLSSVSIRFKKRSAASVRLTTSITIAIENGLLVSLIRDIQPKLVCPPAIASKSSISKLSCHPASLNRFWISCRWVVQKSFSLSSAASLPSCVLFQPARNPSEFGKEKSACVSAGKSLLAGNGFSWAKTGAPKRTTAMSEVGKWPENPTRETIVKKSALILALGRMLEEWIWVAIWSKK